MSPSQKDDFDIVALIELCREKKYESCVAGFGILDKIEKIPLPKKIKNRKLTVQALYALSNGLAQYKYLSQDEKQKIQEEKDRAAGVNQNSGTTFAPVAEEDIEEDFIPEEEEKKPESSDDDDEFGDEDDFEDDDEDEEEDEEKEED